MVLAWADDDEHEAIALFNEMPSWFLHEAALAPQALPRPAHAGDENLMFAGRGHDMSEEIARMIEEARRLSAPTALALGGPAPAETQGSSPGQLVPKQPGPMRSEPAAAGLAPREPARMASAPSDPPGRPSDVGSDVGADGVPDSAGEPAEGGARAGAAAARRSTVQLNMDDVLSEYRSRFLAGADGLRPSSSAGGRYGLYALHGLHVLYVLYVSI